MTSTSSTTASSSTSSCPARSCSQKDRLSSDSLLVTDRTEPDELTFLKNVVSKQFFQRFLDNRPSKDYNLQISSKTQGQPHHYNLVVELKPGVLFIGHHEKSNKVSQGIFINENYVFEGQMENDMFEGEGFLIAKDIQYVLM
jgi:hypothetical protein